MHFNGGFAFDILIYFTVYFYKALGADILGKIDDGFILPLREFILPRSVFPFDRAARGQQRNV